jgi:TPR repeat protein
MLAVVNQPLLDDVEMERDMTDLLVEAEEGNPQAQFECGMMLILGMGLRQDVAAGINFLVEAAMAGHAKARAEMECCYLFGENPVSVGTEEWLALATAPNGPSAFDYYLGYYYQMGILVERSDEQVVACLLRAVESGNRAAQIQLKRFLSTD